MSLNMIKFQLENSLYTVSFAKKETVFVFYGELASVAKTKGKCLKPVIKTSWHYNVESSFQVS